MSLTDKIIVLDIDETLVHTDSNVNNLYDLEDTTNIKDRLYAIAFGPYDSDILWGIKRSGLDNFLRFCFDYFSEVIIWSAGKRDYVNLVVSYIFRNIGRQPHRVYNWDSCRKIGTKLTKPLKEIGVDLRKTLVVDDRETTFAENPNNGILIPMYYPSMTIESLSENDDALSKLTKWLLLPEVMESDNVLELDKSDIFNTEYIDVIRTRGRERPKSFKEINDTKNLVIPNNYIRTKNR